MKHLFLRGSVAIVTLAAVVTAASVLGHVDAQPQQDSGAVGIEGVIPGNPPTQAPTITVPRNGQVFTSLPITVSGLCQTGLLVEVFKNNVFAGSTTCSNSSYSLQIDLFNARNDLVARQYDALDQASPDSNIVTVTFNDPLASAGPRIFLTSAYAKRGAMPGSTLTWPLTLSGGVPPYAISVNWGDNTPADLLSRPSAGDFNITHIYKQSGIYNVTIRATDANSTIAFLQVVGVGNGPIKQSSEDGGGVIIRDRLPWIFWVVLAIVIPLLITSFWLGKKHQLQNIRDHLRKGERPF